MGAARLQLPGARRRERRDPPPLRHRRAEGAVPAAARGGDSALVLLDDRARRLGRRSDRAPDACGRRRRRVGDRRAQVVLVVGAGRDVRDRDGGHRSGRAAAPADEPDPRPGRHAGGRDRPADPGDGPRGPGLVDALRGALHGRAGAARERPRRARRRLPDRAEAARAGTDPPRHALARPDGARLRADVLLRARARDRRRAARREADRPELDRRLGRRDPGLPADDARRSAQARRGRRGARSRSR